MANQETEPSTIDILPYKAEYGLETVKMIRGAFQKAMSLDNYNGFDTVKNHLNYFSKYDPEHVRVAMDTKSSAIAGCMVLVGGELEELYIHVDYQRIGIGGQFMNIAKKQSPNGLELYAFQQNTQAQAFYKKHEFVEQGRGFASKNGNPWATNKEQLADIRYVWLPA